LLTGAGCSHGVASIPNQVFRVNANGTWSTVANLSAWYQTHPTAVNNEDDFEPDGTPYSMVAVRGDLYVVEPNHGSLDRVSTDGSISRVADFSATQGHSVPTTVSYRGNFFIGNLRTFPVEPGSSKVLKVTPSGQVVTWATGLTAVLGSAWDGRGRLYVLESMTAPGAPTPMTGRVRRLDPSGEVTTIVDGLFFPTAITIGPDGNLYIANFGFGPPPIGLGTILKVVLD
jgi:sugar lactone lactonase YvrE